MTLADRTLREMFLALDVESQRAVALHICLGEKSPLSVAAIKRIRRALKRRARGKGRR